MGKKGRHKMTELTHDGIASVHDHLAAELVGTGATLEELVEANDRMSNDETIINGRRHLATGRIGTLVRILTRTDERDAAPSPRSAATPDRALRTVQQPPGLLDQSSRAGGVQRAQNACGERIFHVHHHIVCPHHHFPRAFNPARPVQLRELGQLGDLRL
jgi:hypothetical protein